MTVTWFQDLPLAERDREWDGDAAESRVRRWAGAEDGPNAAYRDAHVWQPAADLGACQRALARLQYRGGDLNP